MNDRPPLLAHEWIAGLEKGLGVIEAFDADHPRMTATEAGERCGMTRTAARRYLKTLAHLGYVGTDGKQYWLMPRSLRHTSAGYWPGTRVAALVKYRRQEPAASALNQTAAGSSCGAALVVCAPPRSRRASTCSAMCLIRWTSSLCWPRT